MTTTPRSPVRRRTVRRAVALLVPALLLGAALAQERLDPGPGGTGPTVPPPFVCLHLDCAPPMGPLVTGGGGKGSSPRAAQDEPIYRGLAGRGGASEPADGSARPSPSADGAVTAMEMRDLRRLARRRTLPAPVLADAGAQTLTESSGGGAAPRSYAEAVGAGEGAPVRTVLLVAPRGSGPDGFPSPRGGGETPFR